jgi:hypothetical protein
VTFVLFVPCQIPEMSHVVALELVIMQALEFGLEHFEPWPDAQEATGVLDPLWITRPKPTAAPALYVKRSLTLVADVPEGDVTVTSTEPVPAGDVALMEVSEFTVNVVAAVDPNVTAVAPVNPLPSRLTTVPPVAGPEFGEIPETIVPYVNLSAVLVADVPLDVVTVTSTVPVPAGDTAVIEEALTTV